MSFIIRTSVLAAVLAATVSASGVLALPQIDAASLAARDGFAGGTCCFHLDEAQTCDDDSSNLFAAITLLDNKKTQIYKTGGSNLVGEPINAGNNFQIGAPLPWPLQITGEHSSDYIQFTYGSVSWRNDAPNARGQCNSGNWDSQAPSCGWLGKYPKRRQMDCCFPC